MSTAWTNATLKAAIQAHIEDTGTDFAGNLDTVIALAEDRCLKDLDFEMWYVIDTSKSTVQGTSTLDLPSGSLRVGDIFITVAGAKVPLLERTYSYCVDYAPGATQSQPKYWAPYSETAIYLAGVPDAVYPVTMKHLKRPAGIAAGPTWLGTNVGDLLFAACMISAQQAIIATEEVQGWETAYGERLVAAKQQFRHLIRRD